MSGEVKAFKESPDYPRSNVCASCAYLLFSLANQYVEENIQILDKHGLYHKNLKHDAKLLGKAFETYDSSFRQMIIQGKQYAICNDYDTLAAHIREFVEKLV